MALFKAVVWALIFLTEITTRRLRLRFSPGVSIAIVLKGVSKLVTVS